MTDTNKILLLFLWLIIAIIMTGVAVTSGGDATVTGLAIFCLGTWFFAFYNTIVVALKADAEAEKRRFLKPQLDAKRDVDCIKRQRENGLPTQEVLQEIADKFGFTLHGEMKVKDGKYQYVRLQMETHKNINQLNEMGIDTYYDIFGKYFLFFKYAPLVPTMVITYDNHLDKKSYFDDNNLSFYFFYSPKYNANANVVSSNYIIQIIDKNNKFIVYRKNGIIIRNSVNDLTENEKRFILEANDERKTYYKGVINGGFYVSTTRIGDGIRRCCIVSPDNPLILG